MVLTAMAGVRMGLRVGDDVLLYRVEGARGDREGNGLDGWRATGAEYRDMEDPVALARRQAVQPEGPAAAPITVNRHVQAIGALLAAEPAADAIETLFNAYAELAGDKERAAFALALVAEMVMGRVATA